MTLAHRARQRKGVSQFRREHGRRLGKMNLSNSTHQILKFSNRQDLFSALAPRTLAGPHQTSNAMSSEAVLEIQDEAFKFSPAHIFASEYLNLMFKFAEIPRPNETNQTISRKKRGRPGKTPMRRWCLSARHYIEGWI